MENPGEWTSDIGLPLWQQDWQQDWIEFGKCMKCGREAELIESRDGDGAHACKNGCGEPTAEAKEWAKKTLR